MLKKIFKRRTHTVGNNTKENMKKNIILFVILTPFVLNAQLDKMYKEEVRKNLRLEDSIELVLGELTKCNIEKDSIVINFNKQISILETENREWKKFEEERNELKQLKKDLTELKEENKSLERQLKNQEIILQQKDRLEDDLDKLKTKEQEIRSEVSELRKIKKEYEQNKLKQQELLSEIEKRYQLPEENLANFDSFVFDNDLVTLQLLFPENNTLIKKVDDWKTIAKAKALLLEKYNESKINTHVSKLKKLEGYLIVNQIISDLKAYEEKNDAIINLIEKLNKHNEVKVKGTSIDLIKDKRKEIYVMISIDLDYNAEINRGKYSYLNSIIEQIKSQKDEDIDADLGSLKKLL